MADKFRFIVEDAEEREVFPLTNHAISEAYSLEDEDKRFSFGAELSGDLTFIKDDFAYFLAFENGGKRCKALTMRMEWQCGAGQVLWRKVKLRLINAKWNLDDCVMKIKPEVINEYTGYEDRGEDEVDLFTLPLTRVTAKYLRGTIEKLQYGGGSTYHDLDNPIHFDGKTPSEIGWKAYRVIRDTTTLPPVFTFFYAREVLTVDSSVPQQPGWILLQDNGATKQYARLPVLMEHIPTPDEPVLPEDKLFAAHNVFYYDVLGDNNNGSFDNGFLLNDLLSYFAREYSDVGVVSDFLQINPENDFATTYPDFPPGLTFHHILFQKSDVRRPFIDNATKQTITFKQVLTDICSTYNLQWKIEDGTFRIEHVSWFERPQTLDLTVSPYIKQLVRTRKYGYKTEAIPRQEIFKFLEAGTDDFIGRPIKYVGDCVSDKKGEREKETDLSDLTTDVEYCLLNADSKSTKVSDDGLVIMACTLEGASFFTISVEPVLETQVHINNCMGWAFLLKTYYPYRRPLINGYINDVYQTFHSVKPIRKRDKIHIKFCCDDVINLTGLVHTDMGDAEIDAGAYNPYKDQLELDLVYVDATPAPPPCLAPTVFRVLYRIGYVWVIETQFDPAGTYRTITEVMFPDGHVESFSKDGDTDGVFAYSIVDISASDTGTYKLRKKIDGPDCAWTDWLAYSRTTATPTVGPCDVGLPEPSLVNKSNYQQLQFRFLGVEVAEDIQVEITVPGNTAHDPVPVRAKTIFSGGTDVIVNILDGMTLEEQAKAQILGTIAGTYRFRFRKQCDPTTYSPWTNYIDVPLP